MSSLFGKSLLAAFAASVVWGGAGVALASDNCDAYAKHTLQQAKENVDRNCGFKGPRWSLEPEAHRAWCKDVGPAGWREELKIRNEKLGTCKG